MKPKIALILKNKFIIINFIFSVVINILLWVFLIYRIQPQEEPIFLHYNIYFGIDLIGEWYRIYIIPALGSVIIFINLLISSIIYNKEKILAFFLLSLMTLSQILLTMAALLIVWQNI